MHMLLFGKKGTLDQLRVPNQYGDQTFRLLDAVHLPAEVSVSHSKGHQKGSTEVTRENQAAVYSHTTLNTPDLI